MISFYMFSNASPIYYLCTNINLPPIMFYIPYNILQSRDKNM